VNDYICERTPPEMFATVLYGVLDPQGVFEFVNAGHIPPIIVRAQGGVDHIQSSNYPLGLFPQIDFEVDRIELQPGDLIVITSDGVTEARDPIGGLFGDARLEDLVRAWSGLRADEVCQRILASVHQFVGTAPQSDDLTVTVLRYGAV